MSDEAKNESVTYFAERAPLDALMKSIDASSKILKIPEVLTSSTGVDILEGISFSSGYESYLNNFSDKTKQALTELYQNLKTKTVNSSQYQPLVILLIQIRLVHLVPTANPQQLPVPIPLVIQPKIQI